VCGRYTNTLGPEEIVKHFRVEVPSESGTGRFDIAPTEEVLAIVSADGRPEARLLRWGLRTAWARGGRAGSALINARMETVACKPSFRRLIPSGSHRALQVADGYFEWLAPRRRGEARRPFLFQVDGGIPFAFAALWSREEADGGALESCVTLTCDAAPNRVACAIHHRMPVILADSTSQDAWLDRRLGASEALALCGALPSERLSVRPGDLAAYARGSQESLPISETRFGPSAPRDLVDHVPHLLAGEP
jgi:putative SOS response-associated peptidase YedK